VESVVSSGSPSEVANKDDITRPTTASDMNFWRMLTFTTLSHPQETITGFMTLGLKRTHDTLRPCCHDNILFRYDYNEPLSVTIVLDIILALSKGVPKFDCSITGTRDNLSVVRAEANGQHIRGVAHKSTSGLAGVQVPET